MFIPKSLHNTRVLLQLGLKRGMDVWEKYNPTALLDATLRRAFTPPRSGLGPSTASIALLAALGGVAIIGTAAMAGIIAPTSLLVQLAGATCFTLLNPFFGGLHIEVADALLILGIMAPVSLGVVNILCLRAMPRVPEGFVKAVMHFLNVIKHAAVSFMRACTAVKNFRFWKRSAAVHNL